MKIKDKYPTLESVKTLDKWPIAQLGSFELWWGDQRIDESSIISITINSTPSLYEENKLISDNLFDLL